METAGNTVSEIVPIYVVIGVTCSGERDILGLWAGDGGEGAKFWLAVLTEIKNRGVEDVCIAVCVGLRGLPDAITTVWPQTVVQACAFRQVIWPRLASRILAPARAAGPMLIRVGVCSTGF